MPKFRKKPDVIEAVLYAGSGNLEPRGAVPDWMWKAYEDGTLKPTNGSDPLIVKTLEGDMTVSPGDYIIRGVQGEIYACKPDIFKETYDEAQDVKSPETRRVMLTKENLLTFSEAAKTLPRFNGCPVSHTSLWRWATKGIKGVHLESRRIGMRFYTSVEALDRFSERLAATDRYES